MYTTDDIRREYRRLDALCEVDTSAIEIEISTRAVKRLGCFRCSSRPGVPMRILISAAVLDDPAQFFDTIRHEYAHALVHLRDPAVRHGHDAVWKAACREVGCAPSRLADGSTVQKQARYVIRCAHCGHEFYYFRRCRAVTLVAQGKTAALRCPQCGANRFTLL